MKWVYILQCRGGYFYVGQTSRLYRRFWEHQGGIGGLNTSTYPPENIVAIYPVNRLDRFFHYTEKVSNNDYNLNHNIYFNSAGILDDFNLDDNEYDYDSLWIENNIAERIMLDYGESDENWKKIRGGKYVRFDAKYKFPKNDLIKELPTCNCGYPCDVKKNEEKNYLYFRCAKKNMWDDVREAFEIEDEPCKFFMKYKKDSTYKIEYAKKIQKIQSLMRTSPWLTQLIGGMYEFCVGGCGKIYDENNTVRYSRRAINLCFDCFINKNEELAKKYEYDEKCLIELD